MLRKSENIIIKYLPIVVGIGIGVLYWILESLLHAYIFHSGAFFEHLLTSDPHELWMRMLIVSMIIMMGMFAQYMVNRLRREKEVIKDVNKELDQIFNTAADGMRVVDKDFNVIRINETLCSMIGITKNEALGKKCYETFHGTFCHTSNCSLTRILNGEECIGYDLEKKRKDGTKISCIITVTPFRSAKGELVGIVEDFKDISDRKRMELDLIEAKEEADTKYLALVKQAKDGVIIVQEGLCKFANKAMSEISGYTVKEILDKPIIDILKTEDKDIVDLGAKTCLTTDEKVCFSCEKKIYRKDRIIRDVEVSSGIILYKGQKAYMGIVRDITEKKRMQEEISNAQKLESIGILAAGIAHDYNNLLTAIIGNLSLARIVTKSGDNISELLSQVEKASHQAKKLTQQLVTFSSGGAPVKKKISIFKLIKDTAGFTLSGTNVRCELLISDDLCWAEIDEGQINQALSNLLINAQQSMPKGGVITISAENVDIKTKDGLALEEGKYIKISVRDEGVGISPENLKNIFDPYFSTKQSDIRKGSGLGLAITYSVIKRHQGYINFESKLGTGSNFTFFIPALEREAVTAKEITEERLYTGHERILVMDDHQGILDTISQILGYLGYEVKCASDGDEAIELYKTAKDTEQSFDAVILDLTISGGMGGKETIQELLKIDPKVKAIVSSGYFNDPVMAEYWKYGFSGVVAKPYSIKELSKVLYRVVMGKESCLK